MTTAVEDRISLEDRVSRLEGAYEHLATKADLAELKAELKSDIGGLKAEFKEDLGGLRSELKGEIGGLRAEFKEDLGKLHASLVKWMVGVMVGGVGAMAGIALLIQRLSG